MPLSFPKRLCYPRFRPFVPFLGAAGLAQPAFRLAGPERLGEADFSERAAPPRVFVLGAERSGRPPPSPLWGAPPLSGRMRHRLP